jgi:hypothetical protein
MTERSTTPSGAGPIVTTLVKIGSICAGLVTGLAPVAVSAQSVTTRVGVGSTGAEGNSATSGQRRSAPTEDRWPSGHTLRTLEAGERPGQPQLSAITPNATPTFSFTVPAESYYVRVRSLNGEQPSQPSNEIRIDVSASVIPSSPTHLLALAAGTAVTLTWRNTYEGGAPNYSIVDVARGTQRDSCTASGRSRHAHRCSFRYLHGGCALCERAWAERPVERRDHHSAGPMRRAAGAGQRPFHRSHRSDRVGGLAARPERCRSHDVRTAGDRRVGRKAGNNGTRVGEHPPAGLVRDQRRRGEPVRNERGVTLASCARPLT